MKNIVFAILLIFGAVIIGFIYLFPEWNTYKDLRKKMTQLETIRNELNDLSQERDQLKEKLTQVPEEELTRAAQALPEGADKKILMVLLEGLTAQEGVKLRNITIDQAPIPGKISQQPQPTSFSTSLIDQEIKEMGVQLGVETSYLGFKRFLSRIEKSLRLIDVFDITFSSATGENTSFAIRAKVYYQ